MEFLCTSRSDRGVRSNHTFGLPKLRRCFKHVETWIFSSFTIIFDDELELVPSCQPLFSFHWLLEVCGCVELLLPCRRQKLSISFFCFWQVGMLGSGHSVCSTCCCLLQVVRACPMFCNDKFLTQRNKEASARPSQSSEIRHANSQPVLPSPRHTFAALSRRKRSNDATVGNKNVLLQLGRILVLSARHAVPSFYVFLW